MSTLYAGDLGFIDQAGDTWTLVSDLEVRANSLEEAEAFIVAQWPKYNDCLIAPDTCTPIARRTESLAFLDEHDELERLSEQD
jgi:hypothetical protein